jgi:hypothetical protein
VSLSISPAERLIWVLKRGIRATPYAKANLHLLGYTQVLIDVLIQPSVDDVDLIEPHKGPLSLP